MKTKEIYNSLNITNSFYANFMKRFLDISISLTAIIILSAVLILLYLLTLIFFGYPAIYKQKRPGKNHKVFNIYKFRSMNNKKDKNGNLLPDEQRVTTFGKIMRKTSLDELPQLFNILKGDMSFVGPRPRLIKDMVFYDKDVYKYYLVRPGLTGPTQVTGRNSNTWEQVFEKDIAYDQNITFWGDIKIFFLTFKSVFFSTGETHSNAEEDKPIIHEYYYADYCLRTKKVSKEQYDYGMKLAESFKVKQTIDFHEEVLNKELFDSIVTKQNAPAADAAAETNTAESNAAANTANPDTDQTEITA